MCKMPFKQIKKQPFGVRNNSVANNSSAFPVFNDWLNNAD